VPVLVAKRNDIDTILPVAIERVFAAVRVTFEEPHRGEIFKCSKRLFSLFDRASRFLVTRFVSEVVESWRIYWWLKWNFMTIAILHRNDHFGDNIATNVTQVCPLRLLLVVVHHLAQHEEFVFGELDGAATLLLQGDLLERIFISIQQMNLWL